MRFHGVTGLAVTIAVSLLLVVPVLLGGCGGASSPEQAVENFYDAIEARDWNAYLSSIYPENVRRMTQTDMNDEEKKFKEADFEYSGLKFKTVYDKKNESKAEVELTDGKITGTNPTTNEKETTTIAEIKKNYGITPTINTREYKGQWYVDVPMASADREQEQPGQ